MSGLTLGSPKKAVSREAQLADAVMELNDYLSEAQAQLSEAQENLETEKAARVKAEKQKREMSDKFEFATNELQDSLNLVKAQQEQRRAKEREVASLKGTLEDERADHETVITEMRKQHYRDVQGLTDQLDQLKREKMAVDIQNKTSEAEISDLQGEIKSMLRNKEEEDRKREQLEAECTVLQMKLADERMQQGERERMSEFIGELETRCALAEAEAAEAKASLANKSTVSLEAELNGVNNSFDGERNSDSDFEFRPAVAVERRNRNRLSIGDEIQQMNLPISQMPLHDREFRYELKYTTSSIN